MGGVSRSLGCNTSNRPLVTERGRSIGVPRPRSLPDRLMSYLTRDGTTRESTRREATILVAMIPLMVRKPRFGEYTTRRREA